LLQRLLVKWIIGGSLHDAAQAGDVARVRALLAIEPELARRTDAKHPLTPLHAAAMQGNVVLAEVLLAHGADINAIDPTTGRTPLHLAACHGHQQMTRYLLARGANRHLTDQSGLTPLQAAENAQKRVTYELLMQQHDVKTAD